MKTIKKVYSKPFNLVIENKYPNLLIGPSIYSKEKENKNKFFTFKNYQKKDAIVKNKEIDDIQWLVKSRKETELEISLSKKKINVNEPIIGINKKGFFYENFKIINNIKVSKPIDKITKDNQMKAKDAIIELYKKTEDVYKIEQLLSMGLLGLKKDRVFVPTKWSITSIDEILSKEYFNSVENNKSIDNINYYSYEFNKNKFHIFLIPGNWSFEMIEKIEDNIIAYDFEINKLKKDYAYNVTGAYYATRQVILKKLKEKNLCSKVIVLRDINKEYHSKGVWVVREGVRETLKQNPINFNTILDLTTFIKHKLNFKDILKFSEILKNLKFQKKIIDF